MIRWVLLPGEEALRLWDTTLKGFADSSPFQSYAWGEYRRALGWETCRWIALDDTEKIVAMMQGCLRRYPFGIGLIWSEGGPVGDLSVCGDTLQAAIRTTLSLKRSYCRFRCDRARDIKDVLQLAAQGWSISWSPLTSNYSMALDLTREESQLLAACDRNFRRNLRNASDFELKVGQWFNPDLDEVLSIYASMQNVKGIDEQLSRGEIEQMVKQLGQNLVIYRCEDKEGKALSLLGTFVMGDKATSLLWATSEEGRKQLASYPSFWELMLHCRRLGVAAYDLAGIDPVRNHGVYRFKRSTGAAPVEYLGEWNWANRPWLLWFGNMAIAERDALRRFEPIVRLLAPFKAIKSLRLKAGKGPVRPAATLAADHRTSPL